MTYISTPEKDAAVARVDAERRLRCDRILQKYEEEKLSAKQILDDADRKEKRKAVIAFQTGRKYYKKY